MKDIQHTVTVLLALAALVAAIVSAVYWFKSAAVPTKQFDEPVASIGDVPEDHILTAVANANFVREAMAESCRLNKLAAIWTGISALLGASTTVAGML